MSFSVCKAVLVFCSNHLYICSHVLFYLPTPLYTVKSKQVCFTGFAMGVDYHAVLGQTGPRPGLLESTGCNAFLWIQSAISEGDTTKIYPWKRPEQFTVGATCQWRVQYGGQKLVQRSLLLLHTKGYLGRFPKHSQGSTAVHGKTCRQARHEAGSRSQDPLQVPCCSSIIYP